MNPGFCSSLAAMAFAAILSMPAPAQERGEPEAVRKAFLITRPKVKTVRRRPPIGLGYTLFQRDQNEKPIRVTASREFHHGDAIRLMIESNTDGYFYLFHTENNQNPVMLFPDARLNGGDNRITAHVPYEAPSSRESDPRFRWFQFDERAATERLYLVVTRQPLPGVLTGKDLVAHCGAAPDNCPWRPAEITWNRIAADSETAALVSQVRTFGQEQTAIERAAVDRGLGLPPGSPAPAVVRMSANAKARTLTLTIDLVHNQEAK